MAHARAPHLFLPRPRIGLGGPLGPWLLVALGAALCVALHLSSFLALVLGAAIGRWVGAPKGVERLGKRMLEGSIVLLGLGLNGAVVLEAGAAGFAATACTLGLALALGLACMRRFGLERETGLLITVGTAICGGSAIAAAAPALRARPEQIGTALGVVFALNAAALILFPVAGHLLGLDAQAFGTWCAIAIHDTSSVVGAAASFGPEALELATITKLARSLWIVPVVALLAHLTDRNGTAARPPWFLLAFLAAAAATTAFPTLAAASSWSRPLASHGLVLALFCIGLTMDPGAVRPRALGFGLVLWAALAAVGLAWVLR